MKHRELKVIGFVVLFWLAALVLFPVYARPPKRTNAVLVELSGKPLANRTVTLRLMSQSWEAKTDERGEFRVIPAGGHYPEIEGCPLKQVMKRTGSLPKLRYVCGAAPGIQ